MEYWNPSMISLSSQCTLHYHHHQSTPLEDWSVGLEFSNIENLYSPGELSIIIDKHISSHL